VLVVTVPVPLKMMKSLDVVASHVHAVPPLSSIHTFCASATIAFFPTSLSCGMCFVRA
jgi:hypothetical protein